MMTVFVAMAELEDGNRAIERAYMNREDAEVAAKAMIKELEEQMQWENMIPIVEEIELVIE